MTQDRQEILEAVIEMIRKHEGRDPLITEKEAEEIRERVAEEILHKVEESDYIMYITS